MTNYQPTTICLERERERLNAMLLDEERWIQFQRDRVAEMNDHARELGRQLRNATNEELRSHLQTTLYLYNQRLWREQGNLFTLEEEYENVRNNLLHDIWLLDDLLGN